MVYKSVWHLLDICKINTWNMYRCDYSKLALPSNKMFALCQIANDWERYWCMQIKLQHQIKEADHQNRKAVALPMHRLAKEKSYQRQLTIYGTTRLVIARKLLIKKERYRNCQAYLRIKCLKCNLALCLLKDRNCFHSFHTK